MEKQELSTKDRLVSLVISLLMSVMMWLLVNMLVIEMNFMKFLAIELAIVIGSYVVKSLKELAGVAKIKKVEDESEL
jgi:hypothetical protein